MPNFNVSTQALQRLPSYIAYLKSDACANVFKKIGFAIPEK
mgnify:CR=1 FL=1